MTLRQSDLDRLLTAAERRIALLWRCGPTNLRSELARLGRAWRSGVKASPRFDYQAAPDFSALRAGLEQVIEHADAVGPWGPLYAERARELDQEAALAEAIGSPVFAERARARFPVEIGEHGDRAALWARHWAGLGEVDQPGPVHRSDDLRDPDSLISVMHGAIGECRLAWRIEVRDDLECAALTADRVVVVCAGLFHGTHDIRRIVVHELFGHVLPRERAAREPVGLFRVGSASSSEDEEGRALCIEERARCLGGSRRTELARRHLAALAIRDGALWPDVVELVMSTGAALERALSLAARVSRGGGLAREIVYLPALSRVRQALELEPDLEAWMRRGRISVHAARRLRELGEPRVALASGGAA
ncbi:MAG: DUF1704 domain-containing protein [Polyangiaceae bacterium]|nr:DUF1704 domain-containing protein [Polyangiaceae bacterium]